MILVKSCELCIWFLFQGPFFEQNFDFPLECQSIVYMNASVIDFLFFLNESAINLPKFLLIFSFHFAKNYKLWSV